MSKYKIDKTEAEWQKELSEEQYRILRQKGTERPFTGEYNLQFEDGTYHCSGCNEKLFEREHFWDINVWAIPLSGKEIYTGKDGLSITQRWCFSGLDFYSFT